MLAAPVFSSITESQWLWNISLKREAAWEILVMSAWVSGYQYTLMQTLYLITTAPYSQELGYPTRSGPFKHPGGPSSSYRHSFGRPSRVCTTWESRHALLRLQPHAIGDILKSSPPCFGVHQANQKEIKISINAFDKIFWTKFFSSELQQNENFDAPNWREMTFFGHLGLNHFFAKGFECRTASEIGSHNWAGSSNIREPIVQKTCSFSSVGMII